MVDFPYTQAALSGAPLSTRWGLRRLGGHRFRTNREHRARRFPDDMFGHASEDETTESLPAVGRHYDQVGAQSFRCLKNFDARIARHDFDFAGGFVIDFLASQPLKLGSRGGLHLAEG